VLGEKLYFSWMYLMVSSSVTVIMCEHLVHVVLYLVSVVNRMDISRLQFGLLSGTDLQM